MFATPTEADPFRARLRCYGAASPIHSIVSGVGRDAARRASIQLVREKGVDWLISAGVCGGLRDKFRVGDIVEVGSILEVDGKRWLALPVLTAEAKNHSLRPGVVIHLDGTVFCSRSIVSTSVEKEEMQRRREADVVDMESAGVADAAAEMGVRFSCIRAVSDARGDSMPMDFSPFFDMQGNLRVGPLLWSVARRPRVIPGILKLGAQTTNASKKLATCLMDSLELWLRDTAGAKP